MSDPFEILGVSAHATRHELRAAFRRLALLHHPDRNRHDAGAAERFKRILRAYRAALHAPRAGGPRPAPPPAGPRPDRYGCASCGDTFPFPLECPRCGIALHDRQAGEAAPAGDPRVDAWMSAMEQRPIVDEPAPERLPMPGLMVAGFLGAAGLVWTIGGPLGPALLFVGFAAWVAAVEGHRLLEPAWARDRG